MAIGLAQREIDGAAVGAPGKLFAAAKGFRRRVADQSGRDRPRRARLAVRQIENKGAAVGAGGFPRVPVTDEAGAVLVEPSAAGADKRALVLYVLRVAAEIGALHGDIAPREQARAIG